MADTSLKYSGGHTNSCLCIDARNDGSLAISGGENGELCVWSKDRELIHKLQTEQDDCTSVCLSQSKENTFYCSFGTAVKVLDIRNLQSPVELFRFNEEEINQVAVDEKESFLAACDDSGEIKVISLDEKRLYKTLRCKHTNICSTVCFRMRKPWEVFSGGMDCNLIHWDFSRPKCVNQFNMQELQDAPSELGAYMVNPPFVHHLSMSAHGKYLACGLENGFISIFDTGRKNISELFTLHAHTQGTSQVAFLDDTKLLSGGNDCMVAVWDLAKMNDASEDGPVLASNGHSSPIHTRNAEITENCRITEIQHTSKINWMKYFCRGGNHFVIIADQSSDLTQVPIPL